MILPLLLLILVMAIDFGRVFFGWVGLQNAARIGAVHAALYPLTDWSNDSHVRVQQYVDQLNADAAAINCSDLDPDPDADLSFPEGRDLGDPVVINLSCDFATITPIMSQLMGGAITLRAEATFPIRSGIVGGTGGGGGGGGGGESITREVPDLADMNLHDARLAWSTAGFLTPLSPSSGQNAKIAVTQAPVAGQVLDPTTSGSITSSVNAPSCSSSDELLPKVVGLTVADARASWVSAGFLEANFTPAVGASDDQVVTTQTADPAADPLDCVPNTTELTVEFEAPATALCLVPDLVGRQSSQAQGDWEAANFTTTVQFDGATPFRIARQDVVQGAVAYCDTTVITVAP